MKRLLMIFLVVMIIGIVPAWAQGDAQTVRIALPQEPETLNPLYSETRASSAISRLLFAPAWSYADDRSAVPVLAAEIPSLANGGISADGTVITVRLRQNAEWSDGEPITAADFLFTYRMALAAENTVPTRNPWYSRFPLAQEFVKSIQAPDDFTVVVTLTQPYMSVPSSLFAFVLPEHALAPVFASQGSLDNAAFNMAPDVVSGPYQFDAWDSGQSLTLTRNARYAGGDVTFETLVVQFAPDGATVADLMEAGGADIGAFVPTDRVATLKAAGVGVVLIPSGYSEGLTFNLRPGLGHPALSDVNVRRAIALGLDRARMNTEVNAGLFTVGHGRWDGTAFAAADVQPYAFDATAAGALLDQAGWADSNGNGTRDRNGTELVLRLVSSDSPARATSARIITELLGQLGIGVETQLYPPDVLFANFTNSGPLAAGAFDLAQYSAAVIWPDPDTTDYLCQETPSAERPDGGNFGGFCAPDLDALYGAQLAAVEPNQRIEIFQQMDRFLYDNLPWLNLWTDPDVWAISTRIRNTRLGGADPFWNAPNWAAAG